MREGFSSESIMFDIGPVRRHFAITAAALVASLSFASETEAGGNGKPLKRTIVRN
jgi:hypothetical protein